MPWCAAVNCTNSAGKGFRLFRFPRDETRRKTWLINCHRDKWLPTNHSVLCEAHFEQSQFEQNRLDGWKKLKPNAIPTIFDFDKPNSSKARKIRSNRKAVYNIFQGSSNTVGRCNEVEFQILNVEQLFQDNSNAVESYPEVDIQILNVDQIFQENSNAVGRCSEVDIQTLNVDQIFHDNSNSEERDTKTDFQTQTKSDISRQFHYNRNAY